MNFQSESDTRALVHQVSSQDCGAQIVVCVVDNSPRPDGVSPMADLANKGGQVRVLASPTNLGYLGGAAWALETFLHQEPMPRWVAVCNPDLGLQDRHFFRRLIGYYPGAYPSVVAPAIRSASTGRCAPSYMARRPTRARMHFYKWVFRFYLTSAIWHAGSRLRAEVASRYRRGTLSEAEAPKSPPSRVYAAHGSFLLFNRSYFAEGGDLRFGAFLFGEEVFVAESVRRIGGQVMYDSRFEVTHSSQSTAAFFTNREIARYMRDSAEHVADHYFT